MNATPPAYLELARRLLAGEAASGRPDAPGGAAIAACGRMGASLEKLIGPVGFRSLLSRSLAVTRTKLPALGPVAVRPDGSLEGFEAVPPAEADEAAIALLAELLGLLATFVGETLALQIVRDVWPDAVADGEDGRDEGRP